MYFNAVIGQEKIKKAIKDMCKFGYVSHSQLFIDGNGYGGLPIALNFALLLIYGEDSLNIFISKGTKTKKLLQNPDLHFIYPIYSNKKSKKSLDYIKEWFLFIEKNIYGSYSDWLSEISFENKEGIIGVNEIENLQKHIHLKSFFGGNKVVLIWGIDKMTLAASNKILKLLEEPPKDTFFLMVAEDNFKLLPTISSRCQITYLNPIEDVYIKDYIKKNNINKINFNTALGSVRKLNSIIKNNYYSDYESLIIELLRLSFNLNKEKVNIILLFDWVDKVSLLGREKIKDFFYYSVDFLRDAFLLNFNLTELVHFQSSNNFELKKLSPFITEKNFKKFVNLFENSQNQIEQNANTKMLLTEIVLKTKKYINLSND